ncbi:hypothetical protein Arub01_45920 [Actinomadura rubrobrunea]|uniref:Uncharacterized protein n=1 Tax=Actinomadura rubrobrunea TaxID=115335 RepID=A0A9W6UXP6_9ACTN|nr:hypothetical protein Arub01_45920 [Actinomadura rubrobrunea]
MRAEWGTLVSIFGEAGSDSRALRTSSAMARPPGGLSADRSGGSFRRIVPADRSGGSFRRIVPADADECSRGSMIAA